MKNLVLGAIALMLPASGMALAPDQEVGYPKDGLATEALLKGDNELALQQLMISQVDANDPARLINLGRIYSRMGRIADAAQAFQSAIDSSEHFDLLLSDGRIMDSRVVARKSLAHIQLVMAAR